MLIKVQHGAARYRVKRKGGGTVLRTAFRGMTVEVPEDEGQRLIDQGAAILPDQELPRGGRMMPLPSTASDEELKAWVSVATSSEIDEACERQPKIADRIRNARKSYEDDMEAQNELQGGVPRQPEKVDNGQLNQGESQVSVQGTVVTQPVGDGQGNGGEPSDEDLDKVVEGTVGDVSEFLSDNPELSQRVLDAEARRANAKNEEPRKGVLEAVQVAAAHTVL